MSLFQLVSRFDQRKSADLLVLPFYEGRSSAEAAAQFNSLSKHLSGPIQTKDFQGSALQTSLLYIQNGAKEKRVLLLGLGPRTQLTQERLRCCYAKAVAHCQRMGLTSLNAVVPTLSELRKVSGEESIEAVAEGIALSNYRWEMLGTSAEETVLLKHVTLIGVAAKYSAIIDAVSEISAGVMAARDLINGNADQVTPEYLVATAKDMAKRFSNVKVTVHDKARLQKEGMGLILAVGRGSVYEPAMITLKYQGAARSKDHTILVGKGVTYDTGGLNMKPGMSMNSMRDDMSGAACALATVATAAALKLPVNVTAVVPTVENAVDGTSFKPGDVYTGYDQSTVEIGNTDAEGRLILADALAYAEKKLAPTRMIDLATLTGSVVVALGGDVAGLFSDDDKLSGQLLTAGERVHELLWRMPLHKTYRKELDSDFADIKNIGGRAGGSILAALFLKHFVKKCPWAHIDIAGVAFQDKESGYRPKYGVGFGVRLLVNFLKNLSH